MLHVYGWGLETTHVCRLVPWEVVGQAALKRPAASLSPEMWDLYKEIYEKGFSKLVMTSLIWMGISRPWTSDKR